MKYFDSAYSSQGKKCRIIVSTTYINSFTFLNVVLPFGKAEYMTHEPQENMPKKLMRNYSLAESQRSLTMANISIFWFDLAFSCY